MANVPDTSSLFPEMGSFAHKGLFDGIGRIWEALPRIGGYIAKAQSSLSPSELPRGLVAQDGGFLFCVETVVLERPLYFKPLAISVGEGTKIEPTAFIKGPAIIGRKCEVRHGAYLRGEFIAGDTCTLGHTTEIKGSIIMNHSEMGHFNYIGDSIIGSYVNIGAGTKLANLKFRTADAKKKVEFPEMTFTADGETVRTGISKFGAVLGDYCELGCNSVLSPASILSPNCWVYPNATVPSGIYPPKTFLAPDSLRLRGLPLPKRNP